MAAFVRIGNTAAGPFGVSTWIGASTDTKPSSGLAYGSMAYEYDTQKWYITNDGGATWTEAQNLGMVLGAGTAVIGKLLPARTIVETQFTATASMVVGTHKLAPGVAYKVVAIELHNSAAPSTGTQNLVLTLDNGTGSAYDVTLLSLDLVANAVTDLRFIPEELLCKATDVITAALINSDAVTWGLTFKHELVG